MKTYVFWWRCLFADMAFLLLGEQQRNYVKEDVAMHLNKYIKKKCGFFYALNYTLLNVKPFRSIYEYRVRDRASFPGKVLIKLSSLFLPKISSVEITGGTFGGGLHIAHNSCVVHVERAGKNLSIGPGVVIGKKNDKRPIIGDNVTINGNSCVIGGIRIGNNSIIGAGSL